MISSIAGVESNSILPPVDANPRNASSARITSPVNVISPDVDSPMSMLAEFAPVISPPVTVKSLDTVRLLEIIALPMTWRASLGEVTPMPT